MLAKNGYGAYANSKIMTASPAELTLMLYEGAIKFCNIAIVGIEQKNIEKAHNNIVKVQNIITEFRATLDENYEVSKDFDNMWEHINKNTFIYLDPPYLITLGSYNDGKRGFNGWTKKDEIKLLEFLSKIDKMGVKFMLSNVLEHKDKKNDILIEWIKNNGFKVIEYKEKARKNRKEVIIINYDKEDFND